MSKDQKQHRIPRVYLKQWSFIDPKTNADTLNVVKHGDPVAHYKYVKTFTAVENLFDTTLFETGNERFFDEMCKQTETNYPKVIDALENGNYDGQTRIYLTEFLTNLFVRQESTFDFFCWIIKRKYIRKKLFKEISILEEEHDSKLIEATYEEMVIDPSHSLDSKVSAVIVQAWKHFKNVFLRFAHVILKAPNDRSWFTTDNPVIVYGKGTDGWVAGPDAEIFFPVSKNFLIYMHLPVMKKHNPLTELPEDSISQVTLDTYDKIMHEVIIRSKPAYHILSENIGYFNTTTDSVEERHRPVIFAKEKQSARDVMLLGTPSPPTIDDPDLEILLSKLGSEYGQEIVPVQTSPSARRNECVQAVDEKVKELGGRRILGWQIWKGPYLIEAEFHAIWETPEENLLDVSLKEKDTKSILFVYDPRIHYKGRQINNVRINLINDPLVDDFISCCDIEFKLMNKGKRGDAYGEELWSLLSHTQRSNLNRVVKFKNFIWNFLEDGGTVDSPCPCNGERKYKNCHGKEINLLKLFD